MLFNALLVLVEEQQRHTAYKWFCSRGKSLKHPAYSEFRKVVQKLKVVVNAESHRLLHICAVLHTVFKTFINFYNASAYNYIYMSCACVNGEGL